VKQKQKLATLLDDLKETRSHLSNTINLLYEETRKRKIQMPDELKESLENADEAWKRNYDQMIGYLEKHPQKNPDQYGDASWKMLNLRRRYSPESSRIKGLLQLIEKKDYGYFKSWETNINTQSQEI